MVAQAWFLVSSLLLVVSGIAKIADPVPTSGAMHAARLPHGPWLARALGVLEATVGVYAIVFGGVAVGGVAAIYLAFTISVVVALRLDLPLSSCGCFGRADTPPTWLHAVYNASATSVAVVVAVQGWGGLGAASDGNVFASIMYIGFATLAVFASYLVLSELPRVLSLSRSS